jgi:hypothetical protein
MENYRSFILNAADHEIEAQRDYLSTMRTIRQIAENDNQLRPNNSR